MGKKPLTQKIQKQKNELPDFDELILTANDVDDRTKSLWIEIYTNAVEDRERISVLYTDIFREMKGNAQGHMLYGPLVTKYLEKMAKSNDQLLKIVDQIMSHKKTEGSINPDDLLDQLQDDGVDE